MDKINFIYNKKELINQLKNFNNDLENLHTSINCKEYNYLNDDKIKKNCLLLFETFQKFKFLYNIFYVDNINKKLDKENFYKIFLFQGVYYNLKEFIKIFTDIISLYKNNKNENINISIYDIIENKLIQYYSKNYLKIEIFENKKNINKLYLLMYEVR